MKLDEKTVYVPCKEDGRHEGREWLGVVYCTDAETCANYECLYKKVLI